MGLGLVIVECIGCLFGYCIVLCFMLGCGSVFSVEVLFGEVSDVVLVMFVVVLLVLFDFGDDSLLCGCWVWSIDDDLCVCIVICMLLE